MKNFDYYRPANLDEAREVLAKVSEARIKGGGTDLMGLMKSRIATPDALVAVDRLTDLIGVARDGTLGLKIGASTTIAALAEDALVRAGAMAVADAAEHTATPLVRARATVGGNLCQRPRCWYFRHPDYPCSKKGGDTCFAQEGENKYHAIFENITCNIVHPSNLAPAFWAHDGVVHVQPAKGALRNIPLDQFWVLPEEDISREVSLEPGDLVTGVTIKPCGDRSGSAYTEVREKQSYDWAMTSCAARVDLDGERVKDLRIIVASVAPVPLRRERAEAVCRGQAFSEELAWKAGDAAVEGATPLRDNQYKVRMLRATVAHTLMAAHARAKGGR